MRLVKEGASRVQVGGMEVLDQIRERWLANMRHDLCGPLFTCRGYVRLVLESQDGGQLSDTRRRYLGRTLENLEKLVTLARELDNCPVSGALELTAFEFREMLLEALAEAGPFLDGKNLQLPLDLSSLTVTTIGDRNQLSQALREFLAATVRCTNSAGTIEVTASEAYGQIKVQLTGSPVQAASGSQPDISGPSSIWRLHGGSVGASWVDGRYSLVCELPVIQPPES